MDAALQNLVNAVRRRAPNPVDEWEATAWVESFGWTDERIRTAFGLPDTRTLGRQIYRRAAAAPRRASPTIAARRPESLFSTVAATYSRTLVYALPWLVTFAIEGFWPDVFNTEPAMAG
ncbi:MAG TPA: hypothetical protein VJ691_08900, partial [Vicinamibacterales bacterium]|nr:hypothetical protein [Vicinamibacterales bacterium]